ncbi:MAG: stress responsive alpha-beta barrel domain-containing protein [Chitinophagaceae bacterium]|nr:MAG: stress responsive alpha-beta barrel domain-containing protein [Chitinophagaceae bacterium]
MTHSVFFTLRYPNNSVEENLFFEAVNTLITIPGIVNFRCVKQTSKKNDFDYGIMMEFNTQKDYEYYASHPIHSHFVQHHWIPSVEKFMELDYEKIN